MLLFLKVFFTEFIAEMGDKTQLMLIALTSKYKLRDIILGTAAAILVLNGLAVLAGAGAGIGIGIATSKATEAVARQPEAESKISKALLLGCALAEATAIYGFVIGLLIIIMLG